MKCFHIRWSSAKLDWECHPNREAAERAAQGLLQVGENFSIEEHYGHEGKGFDPSASGSGKTEKNASE